MLKLENVSKKFKSNVVVDNISFELLSGKMLGFLGRNGAGKTTTF
ncbi:ATP-binding cassette domain-containing protein, partial [Staphylococcus aureus]